MAYEISIHHRGKGNIKDQKRGCDKNPIWKIKKGNQKKN